MMSKRGHMKLPSFTELTSNFSNGLQLPVTSTASGQGDAELESRPGPAQFQSQSGFTSSSAPHRISSSQHMPQQIPHIPPQPHPGPHAPAPHQVHQVHQVHQIPPQYPKQQEQQLRKPHSGNASNAPYMSYQFPVSPTSVLSKSGLPPLGPFVTGPSVGQVQGHGPTAPTSFHQSNYAIAAPSQQYGPHHQLPPQGSFQGERGQSTPFPAYPMHQKSDSYDSQTSLSTLADIASSGHVDLPSILGGMERLLDVHKRLGIIFRDLNNDFQQHLHTDSRTPPLLALHGEYYDHRGHRVEDISAQNAYKVIHGIPVQALKDAGFMVDELKTVLDQWLIYRERASQRPVPPTGNFSSASRGTHGHRRGSSLGVVRQREDEPPNTTQPPKRRRSVVGTSGSRKEGQTIALVVKPPTPVTSAQPGQPRDDLNEELSSRPDQICKQCGSNDTPEWRRGPYGVRSLCNACGLFFSKLTRKVGIKSATAIMIERRHRGEGEDRRLPM